MIPKPDPHPIETFLISQRKLSPGTVTSYTRVVRRMEKSGLTPRSWLLREITDETPKNTVLGCRCAVLAYFQWQYWIKHGKQMRDDKSFLLSRSLCPSKIGAMGQPRDPPTPEQYAVFVRAVGKLPDPYRTLFQLLPYTGLRISEMCGLRHDQVQQDGGKVCLVIRGKRGVQRTVSLSHDAAEILTQYIARERPPHPSLFYLRLGVQISTRNVNRQMEAVRKENPVLQGVVQHSFRHLYASAAVKGGADVRTVQRHLGHDNLSMTMRYVHPDPEMLEDGAEAASRVLADYANRNVE